MEIYYIYGFLFSSLVGLAIGQSRGRPIAGLLNGFFLGPIGWLLVLVGPNPKKAKEEKEKQVFIQQQVALQKAQLEALQKVQTSPVPPPPGQIRTIRIAKDGKDLGDISIPQVKSMLLNGDLTYQDYYFDSESNDWMTIECSPDLIT